MSNVAFSVSIATVHYDVLNVQHFINKVMDFCFANLEVLIRIILYCVERAMK